MQTDLYPATGSIHNGFKCHHDVGKILLTCVQSDSYVSTASVAKTLSHQIIICTKIK